MEDFWNAAGGILIIVMIVGAIWGLVALGVVFVNAQNQMNWCQYKNGHVWYDADDPDEGPTGKRWSPNALALGLTGECIDPGDRGL